jgi:ATP-dependent helicase/nuclease subunit B
MEKNISWSEILEEDLENIRPQYEKILEEIIYECIDKNLSKQKQSVKYMVLKRKLTNTMKKVIKTVALSFNQSEFRPYGYEIEFKDDSVFLPMEIDIDNGKKMKIIGKIDRVDMLEFKDNMYIRVVDYKSSGKELKIDKIKEGLSLQLITYMIAFMENKKESKIIPAGMVYFNLSDKLVSLTQYEQDNEKIKKELLKKLKMNGIFLKDIEILNKMDRNFETNSKDSLIDVSKASITRNSNKVLEESEFEKLCVETKQILKDIGKELSSGNVKIKPNKKENYCEFCKYSSTCRKNIEV